MKNDLSAAVKITPSFEGNYIPIVFSSDDNYVLYCCVAIQSLVDNASQDRNYDIFVLDDKISAENKKLIANVACNKKNISIRFVGISVYVEGLDESIFYTRLHFSIASYFRFFIPRIFDAFDKVLYLDCDMIILDDVAKLFDCQLGDRILGATHDSVMILTMVAKSDVRTYIRDTLGLKKPEDYFQSGVLLMNTAKMRKIGFEDLCIERLKILKTPTLIDQDVLNSLFEDDVLHLDLSWNVLWHLHSDLRKYPGSVLPEPYMEEYVKAYNNPRILHCASNIKPWKSPDATGAALWWKYARRTECYEQILFKNIKHTTVIKETYYITRQKSKTRFQKKVRYMWFGMLSKIAFGATAKKFRDKQKKYAI